nr:reverse transcriptase domain-containing protein [Tanacetum cinerariifolium]
EWGFVGGKQQRKMYSKFKMGQGKRVREPRRRNVEPTGEPEGQGNDQSVKVNKGVHGVPDFSTIIAQQLQNLLPTILAQVGNQGSNQGDNRNQNENVVNEDIQGNVRNVSVDNNQGEKMELVQNMSGCGDDQKVKYTAGSFLGRALTWQNSYIHIRRCEVAIGMAWDDFKVLMREAYYPSNEMQNLETELWNHVMVQDGHAAYTDRFHELARVLLD